MPVVTCPSARGYFTHAFTVILMICLHALPAAAQWEPPQRLTASADSGVTNWGGAKALAISGNILHLVCMEKRNGFWRTYYKRSIDAGKTWGPDVMLAKNAAIGPRGYAGIAVSGLNLHAVWCDKRYTHHEVFYRRSTDAGETWEDEVCLAEDAFFSYCPSIAVVGANVHVAWSDYRLSGILSLLYTRSTDGGSTWEEARKMCDGTSHAIGASLNASESHLYLSWYYWLYQVREEAWYRLSVDGGNTWRDEKGPVSDPSNTSGLCFGQDPPQMYRFWMARQAGLWDIRYRHSSDSGQQWSGETSMGLRQTSYPHFSFAVSGSTIHLVWADDINGLAVIQYSASTDAGRNWSVPVELSSFDSGADYPCVTIGGSVVHVVWTDYRNGKSEVYYRRNPTGNLVSVESGNDPLPAELALSRNFPNPFRGSSSVRFTVPQQSHVVLTLHDLLGRRVATVREAEFDAGTQHVRIDSDGLPAGSYLLRLCSGGAQRTRLITVLR